MFGLNKGLVSIFNNILKDKKYKNHIEIYNMCSWKEVCNVSKKLDKLICFGDKNSYNLLKTMKVKNLINFKYSIDIYITDEEFSELSTKIVELSYKLGIETQVFESYEEFEIYADKFCSVILSRKCDNSDLKLFKEKLKIRKLLLNENPYANMQIDYEIIEDIFSKEEL